jgi:ADP-ribose pyrophosphatase
LNTVDVGGMKQVSVAVTYSQDRGRFLVAKRAETMDTHPGLWNFPSGKIEDGEEPLEAALRELREETGLIGEALKTADAFEQDTEYGRFRVHPVLVMASGEPELNREHTEYRWIKAEEIREMETVPGIMRNLGNSE